MDWKEKREEINVAKKEINGLLLQKQEDYFDIIDNYLQVGNKENILGFDAELYAFHAIYLAENFVREQGVTNTFYCQGGFKELIRSYQTLIFLLRRIELRLPIELQMEIIDFLKLNQVSPIFVLGIINFSPVIYDKKRTSEAFIQLWENA